MENIQERAEKIGNEVNGAKNDLSAKVSQLKDRVEQAGHQAVDTAKSVAREVRDGGGEIADKISSQTSRSLESIREYVSTYPIRSITAAVGIGMLVGYLRKRS